MNDSSITLVILHYFSVGIGLISGRYMVSWTLQLPLSHRDAVQREELHFPGLVPRCHSERSEWNNNAHVTAAFASPFRSSPKNLFVQFARPTGRIKGGERRGHLGAKGENGERIVFLAYSCAHGAQCNLHVG